MDEDEEDRVNEMTGRGRGMVICSFFCFAGKIFCGCVVVCLNPFTCFIIIIMSRFIIALKERLTLIYRVVAEHWALE